jgi:hypothetical protein
MTCSKGPAKSLNGAKVNNDDKFQFILKPISAVGSRAGDGPNIRVAIGIIQRTTALRAYNTYPSGRDWMEKLSAAYIVALATRSADTLLMQYIQDDLAEHFPSSCTSCREASIGLSLIRERLFPTLKSLRENANKLVHHLDDPQNKGVADLNIEGVFSYCYHFFQENEEALFGIIPSPQGKFHYVKCKKCRR